MNALKYISICLSFALNISCSSISYLWHVSGGQLSLLNKKVSIEAALEKYDLTEDERKKLLMTKEIKGFARSALKMDIDEDIYSSYVQLDEPYVTYILRAAPEYELKAHTWSFPVVGSVPYKGFFEKEKALEAQKEFPEDKYDTFVRGVAAYSTLDWFEDPILSSMLAYSERDFAQLLFHELSHTVLFFKGHIDFNERFAEFVGRKAVILFYLNREGEQSPTAKLMQAEWQDELLFSSFMVKEFESLDKWYKDNTEKISPEQKQKRLKEIQTRFRKTIQPHLQVNKRNYFLNSKLNNALLLSYRSYNYNMEEFEKAFSSPLVNKNISAFIDYCKKFENEEDPEAAFSLSLKEL